MKVRRFVTVVGVFLVLAAAAFSFHLAMERAKVDLAEAPLCEVGAEFSGMSCRAVRSGVILEASRREFVVMVDGRRRLVMDVTLKGTIHAKPGDVVSTQLWEGQLMRVVGTGFDVRSNSAPENRSFGFRVMAIFFLVMALPGGLAAGFDRRS
ncbi:MAG TPA: hypothetical protein VMZ33_06970 [Candidatus Limnocylindrales bacterium]|nr:hypothetical protein [Candidatus Limnocylindrales bacterium]